MRIIPIDVGFKGAANLRVHVFSGDVLVTYVRSVLGVFPNGRLIIIMNGSVRLSVLLYCFTYISSVSGEASSVT